MGKELSDLLMICEYNEESIAKILLRAKKNMAQIKSNQVAASTRKTMYRRVPEGGGGSPHQLTPLEVSPLVLWMLAHPLQLFLARRTLATGAMEALAASHERLTLATNTQ